MLCEFSPSYAVARSRLFDAARLAGAGVDSIISDCTAPDGEELAIDIASLGDPGSKNVFFLCSGTHGVEGFAGSAIQTGLLKARAQGSTEYPETRIVLIHALNPYGFAWLRRANEDNVDLNRNFAKKGSQAPVNERYLALADALAPRSLSKISELQAFGRALWFAAKNGFGATKQAITGGQFSDPRGLFYGGRERSWSARMLEIILSRYGRGARDVVFLDVHTGLGKFATSEIMLNSGKDTPEWGRATEIWPGWVKTTKSGEAVAADLYGTLKLAVPKPLPAAKVTAASIEFGTLSAIRMLRVLRSENWLHHFGDQQSRRGKRIKADLQAAFCPDDQRWYSEVCRQGLQAVDQALRWLGRPR